MPPEKYENSNLFMNKKTSVQRKTITKIKKGIIYCQSYFKGFINTLRDYKSNATSIAANNSSFKG